MNKKAFHFKSQNKQIMLSLMIACTVGIFLLVITFVVFKELQGAQNAEAEQYIIEITQQYKDTILKQIEGDLQTLHALSTFIEQTNNFDAEEILLNLTIENDENKFLRMGYVDASGLGYFVDLDGTYQYGIDVKDQLYIQKALTGHASISDTIKDKLSNSWVNCYAVPIYQQGQVIGALTATILSSTFSEIVGQSLFHGEGYSHIIDEQGNFIIRSKHMLNPMDLYNIFGDNTLQSIQEDMLQAMEQKQHYFSQFVFQHEKYWVSLVPVKTNNWYVFCIVPQNVVNDNFTQLIKVFSLILLFLIILFISLICYIYYILKREQQSIANLAFFDKLTGIYNKNKFSIEAWRRLSSSNHYSLVLFDIDNFKFINEMFTYQKGNALLQHVAAVLRQASNQNELFYRDTADRFGLLLHEQEPEQLKQRVGDMLKQISQYVLDEKQHYNIVCSCGIKIIEAYSQEIDLDIFMDRASLALRKAKGYHENTIIFYDDRLHAQAKKKNKIENRMNYALQHHEFLVTLQPKINLCSGKVYGAEALVRWQPPQEAMIYPDEFIPIFENNGFITKLDMYVMELVCQNLRRWMDLGYQVFPISINQSRVLFYKSDYLDLLQQIVQRYHIPPSLIILEFTEGIAVENTEEICRIIAALHEAGFSVSMDDFGSGYSSLNILNELSIDELKLDKVFLSQTGMDERRDSIVRNVIHLAKDLSIITVAEGIETEEQVQFLKSVNCDIGQGYYYAKPMMIQDFEMIAFASTSDSTSTCSTKLGV